MSIIGLLPSIAKIIIFGEVFQSLKMKNGYNPKYNKNYIIGKNIRGPPGGQPRSGGGGPACRVVGFGGSGVAGHAQITRGVGASVS